MNKIDMANFKIADNIKLDADEQELLAGLKGSKSIFSKELSKYYQNIAKSQKNRNKSVSMRISDDDFLRAKAKSIEEGIPYQVLLAGVIHKWLHGKFKEAS